LNFSNIVRFRLAPSGTRTKRVAPFSFAALAAAMTSPKGGIAPASPPVVTRGLRTVVTILATAPGLDREQGRKLDLVGGEIRTMYLLGAIQRIVEGQFQRLRDGGDGPELRRIVVRPGFEPIGG
jgi:hypothetical protein